MGKTRAAKVDVPALHEAVDVRLATAGQRYTEGRRRLVETLAAGARPLTMYDILRHVPEMPQSSAYRHLTVLASGGVVRRLAGSDDNGLFELTEELSGHHHHHVICQRCGAVVDIASTPALERALTEAAAIAAADTGFLLDGHRMDLTGTCPGCA